MGFLRKTEVPERVSLSKDDYIKNQIEFENLKFRNFQLQQYVVDHKHLDREVVGAFLGLNKEQLEKGGINNGI